MILGFPAQQKTQWVFLVQFALAVLCYAPAVAVAAAAMTGLEVALCVRDYAYPRV
jgi:hypothetical protein